jgi:hypothetical protein
MPPVVVPALPPSSLPVPALLEPPLLLPLALLLPPFEEPALLPPALPPALPAVEPPALLAAPAPSGASPLSAWVAQPPPSNATSAALGQKAAIFRLETCLSGRRPGASELLGQRRIILRIRHGG